MTTPPFNPQPCDSGDGPAENVTLVSPIPLPVDIGEPVDVNVLGTVTVAEPVTVDGTVSVNEPVDVNVLGTVAVAEPVTVDGAVSVTGTVTANVNPNPLPVTGTVAVSPNPLPVTGTVVATVSPNPLPVTGTVTATAGGPATASATLTAVAAAGPGTTVDFAAARSNATLFVQVTGTVTAGVVDLEGSQDGTNWTRLASSAALATGVNQFLTSSNAAFRWYRGVVSSAVLGGGSVTATLMYT